GQHRRFVVIDLGVAAGGVEIPHHDRERFAAAVFAAAQRPDHVLVVGAAGQVVAADTLDRHHRALGQRPLGGADRRVGVVGVGHRLVAAAEPQPRPAVRAGDRLGVEPPVGGVVVLLGAPVAHGEIGHGGGRPVVGQRLDDGEPGPAVGAGDERVPVPPVGGVEQFGHAVVADRDVGWDRGGGGVGGVAVD